MGLLSGGIILRKKRELMNRIMPFKSPDKLDGNHVTDFNNRSIYQMKMNMRKTMNEIAETMDDNIKKLFIEESKKVFSMNNEIIRSVEGAGVAILKKIILIIGIICMFLFFIISYYY